MKYPTDMIYRLNQKGEDLFNQGQYSEALAHFRDALQFLPNSDVLHYRVAACLYYSAQPEESIRHCDAAISLNPNASMEERYLKGVCQLSLGDFENGWQGYEYRFCQPNVSKNMRPVSQPRWTGSESIKGKTVLVWAEQGLGDNIQFFRYVRRLQDLGATVVLQTPECLMSLYQEQDDPPILTSKIESPVPFDFHIPLMSLPLAFNTTLDSIPATHIFPNQEKSAKWESLLRGFQGLRVGLVWSGSQNPCVPQINNINKARDIPLSILSSLSLPGIDFFSLQLNAKQQLKDTPWPGQPIQDYTHLVSDVSDTAALIDNLDLVITVDTAVAHLSASIGTQTWLLNKFASDWRWMQHTSESPWYPSMTIFRQESIYSWQGVVDSVREELKRLG